MISPIRIQIDDISIHALRVEGDRDKIFQIQILRISIHALRVEGDACLCVCIQYARGFLSTPSGWRVTPRSSSCQAVRTISIHALRVEGDARKVR